MKIPTMIRGVLYESIADAARKLGVSHSTVWQAIEAGRVDKVGLPYKKPITIRGIEYESYSAAARALGVTPPTVREAVQRGNQDNIGRVKYG